MGKKKTQEEFYQEIKKRFSQNNIEILEYSAAFKPFRYRCKECGTEYYKTRANHIYENKTLCLRCHPITKSKIRESFIKSIQELNNLEIVGVIGSTGQSVKIKCLKCGYIFEYMQNNFLTTVHKECPKCGKYRNTTKETIMERMGNRAEEYTILEFNGMTKKAKFKHKCGFEFTQLPGNFLKGRGCPKCYKYISKGEQKISKWLEKHNIEYISQKRFDNFPKKSFDFFLPNYNTLIEYQGQQHYEIVDYFGGEEKFINQQKIDNEKRQFCQDNQIQLIEIPYYENYEKFLLPLIGSTTSQEAQR